LIFPMSLYSEEPTNNADDREIKSLVQDFYSSSGKEGLLHRFELLCKWDKKTFEKDQIINIWAHQLHIVELKRIKNISIKDTEAEVLVEISIKPVSGEEKMKIIPVHVKKEEGEWKVAYLYFQPPLFTIYP